MRGEQHTYKDNDVKAMRITNIPVDNAAKK